MVNKKTQRNKKANKGHKALTHKRSKGSSVIDVRSPLDVKKALDIINKSKITLVLVYADWCPHCHTYKPFWQKLSKEKGNGVGMVAVEQANSAQVLNNINDDSTGRPINVDAFPQVIAVGKTPNGTNSGVTIENRSGEEIVNLAKNGSNAMNNNVAISGNINVNEPSIATRKPSMATRTPTPYPSNNLAKVHGPKMSESQALSLGAQALLTGSKNSQNMYTIKSTPSKEVNSMSMASRVALANANSEIDEEEIENTVNESGVFQPPSSETELGKNSSKKSSFIGGGCGCGAGLTANRKQGGSLYESLVAFAGPAAPAAGLLAAQQTLFKRGRASLLRSHRRSRKQFKKILKRRGSSTRRRHRR